MWVKEKEKTKSMIHSHEISPLSSDFVELD